MMRSATILAVAAFLLTGVPMAWAQEEAPPSNYEHLDQRVVELSSPLLQGRRKNCIYPMKYRYVFSSVTPQIIFPSEG